MKRFSMLFTGLVAFVSIASATIALPDTFSFTSGDRSAEAIFTQSGSNLVVTLTNTSSVDVTANAFLLTAVFFDITPSPTLTPVSGFLGAGSTIENAAACNPGPCAGVTDVGGEWAYASGLAGPGGATQGISSTGLGLFGPTDNFPGTNLDDPGDVDGPQFGITSAGDSNATLPSGGNIPYINNSVVFTLDGLDPNGTYTISNVFFLYGTSLTECEGGPCGGGGTGNEIPEPGYLLTLALLAVPVVLKYRRRQQAA